MEKAEKKVSAGEELFDSEESDESEFDLESGDEEAVEEAATTDTKRPAKEAARKKAFEEADLAQEFSKMSVSSGPYSVDIVCPYIMYEYTEDGRDCVSVDFLAPCQHCRFFRLKVPTPWWEAIGTCNCSASYFLREAPNSFCQF
jgi:hypothetical protein